MLLKEKEVQHNMADKNIPQKKKSKPLTKKERKERRKQRKEKHAIY